MTNSSSFRLPSILVMLLTIITIQRICFFAFGFPSSLRPPSYTTVQMKMQSSSSTSNASSSFNTLYNIIPAKQRRTYSGIVLLSTSTSGSSSDEEEINDGAAKSSNGNDKLREVEVVDDASISKSQIQSLKNSDASVSSNIKAFFNNNNKKQKFNRESLSKLGMSALLAYGFVSNVSGVIAVSCAWFIFSKKVWLGIVLIVYHYQFYAPLTRLTYRRLFLMNYTTKFQTMCS